MEAEKRGRKKGRKTFMNLGSLKILRGAKRILLTGLETMD